MLSMVVEAKEVKLQAGDSEEDAIEAEAETQVTHAQPHWPCCSDNLFGIATCLQSVVPICCADGVRDIIPAKTCVSNCDCDCAEPDTGYADLASTSVPCIESWTT